MKELIVVPTVPYSHSQMMRDAQALENAFPKLVVMEIAGYSVEGRELPLLRLGTGMRKVFFCGAHHARDYLTSAYLMYVINVYALAATEKKRIGRSHIQKLLSDCSMFVMPMVNPDGVALAQGGLKAALDPMRIAGMLHVRPEYETWIANINGVDLGRQYPALWEQKYTVITEPASELYNGEAPASEPEVRAVMQVCRNNVFLAALSFYTKGETIEYADMSTQAQIPEALPLAENIAVATGYTLLPVADNPGIYAASFESWFRQEYLRPGLHIKLSPCVGGAMPHNERGFYPLVWEKTKTLCAKAMSAVCDMDVGAGEDPRAAEL